jgi:hypothetical protein
MRVSLGGEDERGSSVLVLWMIGRLGYVVGEMEGGRKRGCQEMVVLFR